ncbi:MAG: PA0069 family radical SAM protein [Steroidobacteraceae bacterium]|nr:PA0069 family radical SAM protein [Nevskiaceae bacterium]MCP5339929.1 PA0069 family radical SAM protein [Nevskiaceae bacterium]MCP5471018.1 PA0069 family radical SAM protein [Nevskiaceae bacterium]
MTHPPPVCRGRGALSRPPGRFERRVTEALDDGWAAPGPDAADSVPDSITTSVLPEHARSIITRNDSPDVGFEQSINPYRGCEHGCIYCYARPSHAYVDLSPGIDFETRLFYKADAAQLLERELANRHYVCKPIMLGANTDPYQPIEKKLRVTRSVLEVLARTRHPVMIVTKGALLERDLDLLADLARDGLARVTLSLPTLDPALKRLLEPRAASAAMRLRLMQRLAAAGVPVGVLVAPVIPVLTDHEVERVLEASAAAGASSAAYVLLRLPYEVNTLFREWLEAHFPETAAHVMARVAQLRGGRDNDSDFRTRMSGQGAFASLLRQRFEVACRRLQLEARRWPGLDTTQFRRPAAPDAAAAGQLSLDF